jgi:hypothetical protein
MEDPPAPRPAPATPALSERALAEKQARQAREAAALRANLLRRKQQQRARTAGEPPAPAASPPCSPGKVD